MTEREKFEEKARYHGCHTDRSSVTEEYFSLGTRLAWVFWQACAKQKDEEIAALVHDNKHLYESLTGEVNHNTKMEEEIARLRREMAELKYQLDPCKAL